MKWTYNLLNLNFNILDFFLNLDLFVQCRSIFQNDDNMIFCDKEKSFGNQKKNDNFCGK
jgi:hypothetical protein